MYMVGIAPEDFHQMAISNGFTDADIKCYYGVLECYTEPKNIDQFISHLKTVGNLIDQFRYGYRRTVREEFDMFANLIQLYSDGYMDPYVEPSRLVTVGIQYNYYRLPDIMAVEKLLKNGVALLKFELDCPTISKYLLEINSYRYTYRNSHPNSDFYTLMRKCTEYFKNNGYSIKDLPNDWGNFHVLPRDKQNRWGDVLWGRIYALKMHFTVTTKPEKQWPSGLF